MSSTITQSSTIRGILRRVTEGAEFARLLNEVRGGARIVSISGLTAGAARALAVTLLGRETNRPLAVVVAANRDLEAWNRDLCFWRDALRGGEGDDDGADVLLLPASESDPYAGASPHAEVLEQRALALWHLARGKGRLMLLTARALARRTISPADLLRAGAVLRRDEEHAPEELLGQLLDAGYVRQDPVAAVGEFSLRGGILDVWSPASAAPVRVEFFGDTVDSLREFDPETQLSVRQLKELEIVPMREFAASAEDFQLWAELARERFSAERYARTLKDHTIYADDGETFAGWEWLIPLVKDMDASAFDYLPREALLIVDEPAGIESYLGNFYETLQTRHAETEAADEISLRPDELFLTAAELRERAEQLARVELRALGRAAAITDERFAGEVETPDVQIGRARAARVAPLFLFPAIESAPEVEWPSRAARRYHGRIPDMAADVRRALARQPQGAAVLFVMPSAGVAERVAEMLADYNVNARLALAGETDPLAGEQTATAAVVTAGRLTGGFELPDAGLIVHIEIDLFDEASDGTIEHRALGTTAATTGSKKGQQRKSKTAAFLSDFRDLKVGDYVVHIDHGLARFGGLQTLDLGPGRKGEFMLLFYAEESKLYVPVERLDLVQRYSSAEGHEPTLDRLGGLGWQKTKAKAKRAMRDMADELLRLYAERKLVPGYAFAADSPWQREFEEGFEYTPTPDQETAIEDIKRDMEATTPMDRLLCGDVGYGKTEVAMRAAFKAVMESKQVAVLTPTTVLAYQHYDTFTARFAAFPVTIDLLSRFRTTREQKEVVRRAEAG
ncbi:MAG: DEAD/DEAH box helicase, partial [Acidobacteriota bacterium]|nr:DEAD/DEAH box helicase [Acidobacteriota bacterium]